MTLKVFIFSDTNWALGRVYRDVMRNLVGEVEYRFSDWQSYTWEEFDSRYRWSDICLTNLLTYCLLKKEWSHLGLSKTIFISHGAGEGWEIKDGEWDPQIKFAITSDSIRHKIPPEIPEVHLMRNGVDDAEFTYTPRSGVIGNLGWCGKEHVTEKRVEMANEIGEKSGLPLLKASWLTYEQVKDWYQTIDMLLIVSGPHMEKETGPLPAFEAIASGVPVIGTRVGNFRHVPGPKFDTVEEAIEIIADLRSDPEKVKALAIEQYNFVIENYSYKVLAKEWLSVMRSSFQNLSS